jgi:hypothetical protein
MLLGYGSSGKESGRCVLQQEISGSGMDAACRSGGRNGSKLLEKQEPVVMELVCGFFLDKSATGPQLPVPQNGTRHPLLEKFFVCFCSMCKVKMPDAAVATECVTDHFAGIKRAAEA